MMEATMRLLRVCFWRLLKKKKYLPKRVQVATTVTMSRKRAFAPDEPVVTPVAPAAAAAAAAQPMDVDMDGHNHTSVARGFCAGCSKIKHRLLETTVFQPARVRMGCIACDNSCICASCFTLWNHQAASIPLLPPGPHASWDAYVLSRM